MKIRILAYLMLVLGGTSCFIADDYFKVEEEPQVPMEWVVKDSVTAYVKRRMAHTQTYLNYGFGDVVVREPAALSNLNKWQSRLGNPNYDQVQTCEEIEKNEAIVKERNLQRTIEIEHVFSLRKPGAKNSEVNRIKFLLDENFNVTGLDPVYYATLSEAEEEVFANFFYESPLIKGYTYEESEQLSQSFYQFYKDHLNGLPTIKARSAFLKHALGVFEDVLKYKAFDQQRVAELMATNYLKSSEQSITAYESVNFSPLYQINESDQLIGYYFFHTFRFENQEAKDSMQVYVKFTPYYEVVSVFETDQNYAPK